MPSLTPFEQGVVVGVLIGEGSFGGDGKQPQITLRMHVRHEALFRWLIERSPGPSSTARMATVDAAITSGWRGERR